jgi:hypothetical protein
MRGALTIEQDLPVGTRLWLSAWSTETAGRPWISISAEIAGIGGPRKRHLIKGGSWITDIVTAIEADFEAKVTREQSRINMLKRFPGITTDEYRHALYVWHDEGLARRDEILRQHERDEKFIAFAFHVFDGLPEGIELDEAARIKAARGDPQAIKYLAQTNTPEARKDEALADAAYRAHPLFTIRPDGIIHWDGDAEDGPTHDEVIDWFQMTHPAEARRIEDEID